MMRNPTPCSTCVHYATGEMMNEADEMICDSFPDGIPLAIHSGKFDHRQPAPGDNGILWERDPAATDQAVATAFRRFPSQEGPTDVAV
jgi:hypothetical protein